MNNTSSNRLSVTSLVTLSLLLAAMFILVIQLLKVCHLECDYCIHRNIKYGYHCNK